MLDQAVGLGLCAAHRTADDVAVLVEAELWLLGVDDERARLALTPSAAATRPRRAPSAGAPQGSPADSAPAKMRSTCS